MSVTSRRLWYGSLIALLLSMACAPGAAAASGGAGAFVGALLVGLFGVLALIAAPRQSANAGSPVGCDGQTSTACDGTRLFTRCCPQAAKCNYRDVPFIECGHGLCTTSGDVGRCPAPTPSTSAAKSEAECKSEHGDWQLVCANKVVVAACLPAMPTNYSGPGQNPPFKTCGSGVRLSSDEVKAGERCTTHRLEEDCFPTKAELGEKPCLGERVKVCVGGKAEDRCLPLNLPWKGQRVWEASTFVTCGDGTCAVGSDKQKVCRN